MLQRDQGLVHPPEASQRKGHIVDVAEEGIVVGEKKIAQEVDYYLRVCVG